MFAPLFKRLEPGSFGRFNLKDALFTVLPNNYRLPAPSKAARAVPLTSSTTLSSRKPLLLSIPQVCIPDQATILTIAAPNPCVGFGFPSSVTFFLSLSEYSIRCLCRKQHVQHIHLITGKDGIARKEMMSYFTQIITAKDQKGIGTIISANREQIFCWIPTL